MIFIDPFKVTSFLFRCGKILEEKCTLYTIKKDLWMSVVSVRVFINQLTPELCWKIFRQTDCDIKMEPLFYYFENVKDF